MKFLRRKGRISATHRTTCLPRRESAGSQYCRQYSREGLDGLPVQDTRSSGLDRSSHRRSPNSWHQFLWIRRLVALADDLPSQTPPLRKEVTGRSRLDLGLVFLEGLCPVSP